MDDGYSGLGCILPRSTLEKTNAMVSVKKSFFFVTSFIVSLFFAACAGLPHSNSNGGSGGGGGGTGPFTLGGTVSGLSGTGLVLQNNAENLTINANGAFSF
jgi:hypothetical protein